MRADGSVGWLVLLALGVTALGACGRRTEADTGIVMRPVADSAVDRQLGDALAKSAAISGRVDTILVQPAQIELRVGEAVLAGEIEVSARDAAGRPVDGFAPVFVLASRIAAFDGSALRGLAPGTAELFIEALPSAPPGVSPRPRPSTRVMVTVR